MKKTALVWFALLVIVSGCGIFGSDKEDDPDLYDGLAVSTTDDPLMPVIATHESGEFLGAMVDPETGDLTNIVYHTDEGSLLVTVDEFGRPSKVTDGEYIYLMGNYRNGLVDVARIDPDGSIVTEEGVQLDENFEPNESVNKKLQVQFDLDLTTGDLITGAGIAVGTFACAKATIFSAGLAALPCFGALVGVTAALTSESYPELSETSGYIGYGLGFSGCGTGSPESCVGLLIQLGGDIHSNGNSVFSNNEQEVASASGVIRFGGVWQYPDRPDDWFVVEKERVFDAFYNNNNNCYEVNIGEFVSVDGNVFTYQVPPDNFRIDLVYTRLNEDELHVERIDPPLELTMSRSTTQNPEYFITNRCGQAASFKESEPGLLHVE